MQMYAGKLLIQISFGLNFVYSHELSSYTSGKIKKGNLLATKEKIGKHIYTKP